MTTIIVSDTFDGAVGSITGHAPEVGGAWVLGSGAGGYPMRLNGSGGVWAYNDTDEVVINAAKIPQADCWAEVSFTVTGLKFPYIALILKSQYDPIPNSPWGLIGSNYIYGAFYPQDNSYEFGGNGSGATYQFTDAVGSVTGTHTLRMQVDGTAAKLYLDGALKLSTTTNAPVANAGWSGFKIYRDTITVNSFTSGDNSIYVPPPLPPSAFWTSLVGTTEYL